MAAGGTQIYEFPLDDFSLPIVKRCQNDLIDILQRKFGCEAHICDVNFGGYGVTHQAGPDVAQKQMFSTVLPSGVKVSVWKADLTSFTAHAVVNAANSRLDHIGGLALALSRAGGPEIQKESNDYIRKKGELQTGQAVLTGAGQLRNCKKIIHAVGPQINAYPTPSEVTAAESLLSRAIFSILECVKHDRLQSVAIPAISSGIFNFPLPLCADTIVKTVKNYYETPHAKQHRPAEVFLVNHDEPSARQMERACRQQLQAQAPVTYSQVTAGRGGGASPEGVPITVNIRKIRLVLKKGNIEDQRTDVIVNTAAPDRKLLYGQISAAISRKAGYEMQSEIDRTKKDSPVVRTKGYDLKCKEVFHTIFSMHSDHVKQTLHKAVLKCLQMAVDSEHRSIAFPAIGTGNLGLPRDKAAMIMTTAVSEFAKNSEHSLDIDFVIFPSDALTFKAFEKEIKSLQEVSPPSLSTEAFGDKAGLFSSSSGTPKISLTVPSAEAKGEVDRWLRKLFQSRSNFTIHNNFILHLGEQEYVLLSKEGVSIEERFEGGCASAVVRGHPFEVPIAGVKVEAMLCNVQSNFINEEELAMRQMTDKTMSFEKQTASHIISDSMSSNFRGTGLKIVKVDKVENPALKELFEHKKKQLKCSTHRTMFQCVPSQFIEMICRIGFQAECAPPDDPAYGEGIYFAGTVQEAMKVWGKRMEEYLYFVEAAVLTGNSTTGARGLILPPPVGNDPLELYNSVRGPSDVSVIFSGYQALPKCIITCQSLF